MKAPIDFVAHQPHWMAHMEPVATEMRRRGHDAATFLGMEQLASIADRVTVVSSSSDMERALKAKRRVVLMEHGAGQSYSNRHRGHVGGSGRAGVELCLLPNEEALARHNQFYASRTPGYVVGCPLVDELVGMHGGPRRMDPWPTVAVSWHFPSSVSMEAGTAWPHIGEEVISVLCDMRELGWIELIGHAHPKMLDVVRPHYEARAIKVVESFRDVCAMADCYMVDNSSTLFEFAALDRPVVVMDSPRYRKDRRHGLRFWWAADVGPRIQRADQVANAVIMALSDPEKVAKQRREIVGKVYPHRGEATKRAADAIAALAAR